MNSTTAPTIVVKNNVIEDFTAGTGTLSFAPFQLRSEANSTGSTTVWNNVVRAGVIRQFIMTNTPTGGGGQTFHVRGNTLTYDRWASPAGWSRCSCPATACRSPRPTRRIA